MNPAGGNGLNKTPQTFSQIESKRKEELLDRLLQVGNFTFFHFLTIRTSKNYRTKKQAKKVHAYVAAAPKIRATMATNSRQSLQLYVQKTLFKHSLETLANGKVMTL